MTEYPSAEYYVMYVYWPDGSAHAIVVIKIDGKYYLIDPQTGRITGPIDDGFFFDPDFGPGLKELLEPYGNPQAPSDWKLYPPNYVNPHDAKPWYESEEVKDWFRRTFPHMNPDDCIWS